MLPLKINRRRDTTVDPKQSLRGYVDQLPIDQQHEFVSLAIQLIVARPNSRAMEFARVTEAVPSPLRRSYTGTR